MPSAHPCRQQHQDKKRASCIFERTGFFYRLPFSLLHGTAGAGPHRAPPAGVTAGSRGTEEPRERGGRGRGAGHRGWLLRLPKGSPDPRQAEPRRLRCCPRRGSGASEARCSQGAHSAPDAFSNLARLARLRQRGRGASALTLARPGGRPRCRGVPWGQAAARAGRAALPQDTEPAGPRLAPGTAGSAPRAGSARGDPVPPKPRHHRHTAEIHVSAQLTEGQVEGKSLLSSAAQIAQSW